MGYFPETIARSLAGGKVECSTLVLFDFTSQPMRLWTGGYTLRTNDGETWQNIGSLGDVTGLEQAINGEAPEATFVLSGIDAQVMRLARDEFAAEVRGRSARAFIQFFGVADVGDPDNQRPLDRPYPVWWGKLLVPTFDFPPIAADGSAERSISITAESLFSLRSRPKYSMNTDRDQQARFSGDKGFEFAPALVHMVLTWPDY